MDSAKQQLVDRLKSATNVLVTVSRDPSVDQLAACIGLALLLNNMDKHGAAVFSGEVPSTLEFLKPEDTIEKNTDSLRDFIIALDKNKADKLRYKVEDDIVRIFITPYKTSLSQADLEFSQGDFNVDVVVGLGVNRQEDLDEAITAHGRILHDATVTSITKAVEGELGSIIWRDPQASSLSELVTELGRALGDTLLDAQSATALLTGIVAETARFSNEKTSAHTMSAAATLMAAGADQQLVATKLEESAAPAAEQPLDAVSADQPKSEDEHAPEAGGDDGTLEIEHQAEVEAADQVQAEADQPEENDGPVELPTPELKTEDALAGELALPESEPEASVNLGGPKLVTEPPTLGGMLTANSQPEGLDPVTDPLSLAHTDEPLLSRSSDPAIVPQTDEPQQEEADTTAASENEVEANEENEEAAKTPQAEPAEAEQTATEPASSAPAPPEATQAEPAQAEHAEEDPLAGIPEFTPPPDSWTPPVPSAPVATARADDASAAPANISAADTAAEVVEPANQTLADLEASVQHDAGLDTSGLNAARDEVTRALNDGNFNAPPPPVQALNAQPIADSLHSASTPAPAPGPAPVANDAAASRASASADEPADTAEVDEPQVIDPNAPPAVPPPFPFPINSTPQK